MICKSRTRFSEAKRARVLVKQNARAFLSTILIGMHVGSLGIRLGRVGIAWDDFYFMDQA